MITSSNGKRLILTLTVVWGMASCSFSHRSSDYRTIHEYARSGNNAALSSHLLKWPGDVHLLGDAGMSPLHHAAGRCNTETVKLLLAAGARVDAEAAGDTTPLHLAAQEDCVPVVDILLDNGAKVNRRDSEGRTALGRAKEWESTQVIPILQAHGALD